MFLRKMSIFVWRGFLRSRLSKLKQSHDWQAKLSVRRQKRESSLSQPKDSSNDRTNDCKLGYTTNSTLIKADTRLRFRELNNTGTYTLKVTWIPLQDDSLIWDGYTVIYFFTERLQKCELG